MSCCVSIDFNTAFDNDSDASVGSNAIPCSQEEEEGSGTDSQDETSENDVVSRASTTASSLQNNNNHNHNKSYDDVRSSGSSGQRDTEYLESNSANTAEGSESPVPSPAPPEVNIAFAPSPKNQHTVPEEQTYAKLLG